MSFHFLHILFSYGQIFKTKTRTKYIVESVCIFAVLGELLVYVQVTPGTGLLVLISVSARGRHYRDERRAGFVDVLSICGEFKANYIYTKINNNECTFHFQ